MRKCVNKKLTALFLAAVMGGGLCTDMTVFAEEVTDQEVIISETEGEEDTASEEENQVEAEPESDESEKPLEELPETTLNEEVENVQVENENNELEEKPIAAQSNGISLQSIEGVCGENLTWSFDETTGTLTISGTGDMYDYYYGGGDFSDDNDGPWYEQAGQISKVVIEKGVTNIGNSAFCNMEYLKAIELPESITSIGDHAFSKCRYLKDITFLKGVTSIGKSAFSECSRLTDIMLPDSVTSIGDFAFSNCSNLTNITLSDSITSIGASAFSGCSSKLTSISIPRSVTSIGDRAFSSCDNLENIAVASDNQNFASENGVLYNKACDTIIRYPEGKRESTFSISSQVTNIASRAFKNCNYLSSINIPDSVTKIGPYAFNECYSLQAIILPDKLKTIEEGTFSDCGLESISIPDSVTKIEEAAFLGCSMESITLPDGLESIGASAFAGSSLRTITIPKNVKDITSFCFERSALESIVLPEGLKSIGVGVFLGCENLISLTIPKTVSEIEELAYGFLDSHGETKTPNAKIKCYTNTAGHKYAKDNGIAYELLDGTSQTVETTKDSKVKVTGIKISGISKKIAAGKKIKLTAKVSPSNATNKSVKWTSSNKKVATVNSKGVVTINKKAGGKSVTITATATDYSKKKATYKISVMKGVVKKVTISGNKPVKAGKTLKLKAKVTATKKANKKLKWTSSNKKYATVSSSGKVKTYKAGKKKKVKITAEATDGSGKKKTVTIKIK